MNTNEKIDCIRQLMEKENISAVIIPSNDPHQSEYLAEHWQARKWLTGFSGSAGMAVVTLEHAILWTDFRYYIQAEKQISGSLFELFKIGDPDVPTFDKWLANTLKPGDIIGIDGNMFSMADVKKLATEIEGKGLCLNSGIDYITQSWSDRPVRPNSPAFSFPEKYTGQSRGDKIGQIRRKMNDLGASYHLMATLDDIAWTLNLRGKDVHTNPVNIAFVLIAPKQVFLFISKEKVNDELVNELSLDAIDIFEYEDIYTELLKIEDDQSIIVDPANTNYQLYQSINKKCKIVEKPNPAIALKAIKNDIQISHLRQTLIKDGLAVVNFLYWLEHQPENSQVTELTIAAKLYGFREKQELFVDNSFDPIMAFKEHSAMCHYSATRETSAVISDTGMFLTDSGGNYLTGTTDITRTIFRGEPSGQEISDYTLVLKGHIAVATILFPSGTRGFQVDTLSRQHLWKQGMDFGHGTGHGVGFFLCVHEGPARISPHPVDVKLEKGMVLTNEPGLYREGAYGIRLENMILVDQAFENEFGTFMKFENLTYCHFERDLIDLDLLSIEEKDWINTYHAGVYEKLSPDLEKDVASWLREKTRPL
ncbi:MAG: aminopeptidase P family protein [Desulfobacula sp.]|jgi:Xaa-Pro aminopeptidase|uniref:aminopeptidase P family protein n=1 Tax=Desulfobacula sp. TaxID=2593537 RepID=UPI001D732E66|nr:aminopeptidase P family protein [Desulfobacula sp.]MBT3485301.1 aminopeptidase P family protein [Desulfobacula sp.]MBT3803639.1 aminopeptidase P family protein [Desulfobacula sp.]MBT4024214.1 aminopeptidase P family protein [Desulfobacula sp.]MBT4199310.1 aminopeptidase P family protein [Desulfobacula sp.]